ncbi:hypothetical protein [Halovenus salina]|uniref:Uncharacterized protein n=1 Tax=Halovenus salina TaxID=1510225 RepID=A0ABD5W6E0_9EURY|nr:hypothetical protein [Halovenus salina]
MTLGPFSAGTILTASISLLVGSATFGYRYIWGAKSHVSLSRFYTLDDSEWRDGRNNDKPVWSRRILVRVSNNGWRDGVISDFSLDKVRLVGDTETTVIKNPEDGVLKTELEHFSESAEMTRLEVDQRTNYKGQIVGGRDDELMGVVPFILQESELGEAMKKAQSGDFKFSATVEDNKRIYYTSIEVSVSLEDSAGGKLSQ